MPFSWKNRRVLITGAGGFIGSHLTEALLAQGARVRALVHYNSRNHWGFLEPLSKACPPHLDVVSGDIRDPYFVSALTKDRDYVFHLAALIAIPFSYQAPQSFVETNVLGTLNVLEACRKSAVKRLVHTSTSETYGTALYVPIDEDHALQGQSPYSASKIAADKMAESYFRSFNLPVITVRPFNTFGPRQSSRAIIPTILSGLLSRRNVLKLGDLRPIRDFTYVNDTVRGFLLAAQSSHVGDVINIGSGKGWSIRQVLSLCAKAVGQPLPRVLTEPQRVRPENSEVRRLICDNQRARRWLSWTPQTSFEAGLRETSNYIRQHPEQYKTDRYNI